jgi:hypothetical protein
MSTAMIAITTRSSIKVNPRVRQDLSSDFMEVSPTRIERVAIKGPSLGYR